MKKVTVLATAVLATLTIVAAAFYYSPWYERALAQLGFSQATRANGKLHKSGRAPGKPRPYSGELPSLAAINVRNAIVDKVYSGLDFPWAMEFISPQELLISEFAGKLKRLSLVDNSVTEIRGLPDIATGKGQVGLMDIALHPQFASNGVIYLSHAIDDGGQPGKYSTAVSRAVLKGDQLTDVTRIFAALPYTSSPSNFGGALEFDQRGYLYIGSGDRSREWLAQSGEHLNGKIIRLTDRGEVPADNPFLGDQTIDDRIYALGVRNPQGLVFDAPSGHLYETEHGPMGGDEVNRIEAGLNYGWSVITYGANYNTQKKGVATTMAGMEQPLFYYLPSIATSPITIYRGDMFPEWQGDLLVGALKGKSLSKLDLVDGRVVSEQRLLNESPGRTRDIKVAQDGSVYILQQKGGRIYRLYRDPSRADLEGQDQRQGAIVYRTICASCHDGGLNGAPRRKKPGDWRARLLQGRSLLYQHSIDGIGAMPPRGLCDNCTDEELRAAVDFMLK
jgi:glucose/arabinose dehydrogenase/cytochrome c5